MQFLIDSREKNGYRLNAARKALKTGDYSIEGFEDEIGIERKSFDDLFHCLTSGQRRFKAQLKRLGKLRFNMLLIDSTISSVLLGHPLCQLPGERALERIIWLCRTYHVEVLFCDRSGETVCRMLLCRYWKELHAASGTKLEEPESEEEGSEADAEATPA